MQIKPISNNIQFCGGKRAISVLTKQEQKILTKYQAKFDYSKNKPFHAGIKRTADIIFSVMGLIITTPIILISSLAIKLDSKGAAIFKQKRIGKDGIPFTIYKLRTIQPSSDDKLLTSSDDKRITRVGKFLRKYSIDEFPQFLNIIKGDMSLIGPRPISYKAYNLNKTEKDFFLRYSVKPGASLNYPGKKFSKNQIPMIITDKNYIENWNLKNDFKILLNILSKVLKGKNC